MAVSRTQPGRDDAPMARFVLPVSGIAVALAPPTGAEDVLLAEHRPDDPSLVLVLVERLARTDAAVDWGDLPITDIDTLIARLRQAVVGDRVVAETACIAPTCGEGVDLSFHIEEWLAHHRPSAGPVKGRAWQVERDADARVWHKLRMDDSSVICFRLPTLTDQIAIEGSADPASALAARCIRPAQPPRRRARVEAAMARLAPPLATPLRGQCPHCGVPITALFQARHYFLRELCDRARFVFDDIDVLAERYHWSERAILTLSLTRRTQYVERARQALTA
jgi:hypothetical protein